MTLTPHTFSSVVNGSPVIGARTVAEHESGEAGRGRRRGVVRRRTDLRRRGGGGPEGPDRVGRGSGAHPRPGDRPHRPARRGQRRGAGPAGHRRDRQTVRRGARRGPRDRRHLRLLPRRGPPAVRPDRAERDGRQAAVHVPQASRHGRGDHGRQLPGRRALVVHRARVARRQHDRLEAGRLLPRGVERVLRAVRPRRRPARRRVQPGPSRRAGHVRGPGTFAGAGTDRQGRLHRIVGGGPGDRRTDRPAPADRVPGARRQEPAGGHAERRSGAGRRGRPVLRLRHRRPALYVAGHGDRPRVRARRVPGPVHRRRGGGEGRRPDQ